MKILIDSSAWIYALRKDGKENIRLAVKSSIDNGTACFCEPVLLELWNGVRGVSERRILAELQNLLEIIPTTESIWGNAYKIASLSRSKGLSVPAVDLLIYSIASEN